MHKRVIWSATNVVNLLVVIYHSPSLPPHVPLPPPIGHLSKNVQISTHAVFLLHLDVMNMTVDCQFIPGWVLLPFLCSCLCAPAGSQRVVRHGYPHLIIMHNVQWFNLRLLSVTQARRSVQCSITSCAVLRKCMLRVHRVCNFGCFGYHNYARLTEPSVEASAIISAWLFNLLVLDCYCYHLLLLSIHEFSVPCWDVPDRKGWSGSKGWGGGDQEEESFTEEAEASEAQSSIVRRSGMNIALPCCSSCLFNNVKFLQNKNGLYE